jgi:16S rRNA (uracil1498-N3)-methyltransferase
MRVPRILVEMPLGEEGPVTLPPGASRHLVQVLRLGAGDAVILFNGDGRDFPGRVLVPAKGAVQVQIAHPTEIEPPPALDIHLGIGVSRGERMDLVVQKAVELGVTHISPLWTRRSLVRLEGDRLERRRQHWGAILVAACEQSGRRRLPELAPNVSLVHWLAQPHPFPLLLDHRSPTALSDLAAPCGALTLLVGPEGGLAPEERTMVGRAGFAAVCLGPRILRTETAPLAALAAAQALWGDFRCAAPRGAPADRPGN